MSLSVVVGEETLAAAHRALLEEADGRLVPGAVHALGCRDRAKTLTHVLPAVAQLRDEGDLGRAFELLARSRDLLAAAWPASWAIEHASIALEDGTPARVMSLLGPTGPVLPDAWRMLLEAHLQYRSGRRREAIAAARAAQERTGDTRVARAAEMIVIRSQNALGETEAAEAGARKLLEETAPDAPLIDRLRPAALLLSILSSHGASQETCAPLRDLCARNLTGVGARERHEVAASLGTEAFQRGDFSAAGTFMEIAVEAAATCHDPANLAIGQMNLAGVYFEEGRTAECEDLNGQALRACLAVGMEVQAAYAQRNLGTVMLATGRLGEALNLCRKAREVLGANPASPNALAALAVESETLLEAGLYESARRSLGDAIDLLAANPIPMIATVIWRDMARLERWTGQLDRSADLLDEARRQARECGASDDEARALIEMAALRIAGGDLCGGARFLDEAAPIVGASTSLELALRFDFARAMQCCRENAQAAGDLLAAATARATRAHLAGWLWRCHAADAGIARSAGDGDRVLRSIYAARRTLLDMLDGIGPEAMRESYVMLCDSRLFLAWCDGDTGTREELPRGGSDLEVFLQ
jgi:tetratricopeptide (TPR) repeat protein